VQRRGFTIGEVPIIFEDRRRGTSKISQNEVVRALQTVERLSARRLQEKFAR
jgi:dolichol-phosphate mannosyltransferase